MPQGAAPGDRTSPTQPFSELTFRPEAKLTGADMWGATIFDQLACRITFHRLRYEGTFTPPSLQGTLVFPGNLGMFEWGGIAVDPNPEYRDRQPDGDPVRVHAHSARSEQPSRTERRASVGHRKRRTADVRHALRRRPARAALAGRYSVHAATVGLHGRYRSDDQENRLDAQERNDPRQLPDPAAVQARRANPGRPDDHRRWRHLPHLDAGLLHPRLRRHDRRTALAGPPCRPVVSPRR